MVSSTVKRSQFAVYLDICGDEEDYELVGDGITTAVANYNPQTLEETYIHQDSGATEVESYRPTFPIEATCKKGDTVWEYIDGLRQARSVLAEARSSVVLVYLYETPTGDTYPAEQQPVSIQIDSFGGDGGGSNKINYTINFVGDPVDGDFDVVLKTFA